MTSSASEMRPNIPSMSGPEFSSAGQGIASSQSTSSQAQDIITCSMQGILPHQGGMAGSHSAILQPPSYLIQQNASVAMVSQL